MTQSGAAYIATRDERLLEYSPGGELQMSSATVPQGWLRAVTEPDAEGTVFGVTNKPDVFFERTVDGAIREITPGGGYTTTLGLTPDGQVLFVPGAHGSAWEHGATLFSLDPSSGRIDPVLALNDAAERELGLSLGGTYSVRLTEDGSRLFVMFNAGSDREDPWGEIVLVVIDL